MKQLQALHDEMPTPGSALPKDPLEARERVDTQIFYMYAERAFLFYSTRILPKLGAALAGPLQNPLMPS